MPDLSRATRGTSKVGAILACLFLVAMLLPGAVLAANTVTPATGTALSADTNSVNGNGAWTTITGPQVNGTSGTLAAGTVIFTIADAGEFAFNPAVGSASLTGAGCGTLAIVPPVPTVVAASVTVTLENSSSGTCNLVLAGLQVRPTAAGAAPLEASAIVTSGTAGVSDPGAPTNLSVVPGAAILSYQAPLPSTSAVAGTALTDQPIVLSKDQFDNVRVGDSIQLASVPSTGGFSCATNPKPTNGSGLASFVGEACTFTKQGSYVIRASVGGVFVDSASSITVTPATATKLVITTQPGHGTPSSLLASQPVVAIQDNFGNTVTLASATVLLTKVAPDAGGPGTLLGCSTAPTVNGVATFSGCRIDTIGVGYRLTASDSTGGGAPHPYLPVTSTKFDVRDRVVFTQDPSASVTAGVAFFLQPVVAVRAGATNTAVNDSTTSVTLSLKSGTGATGAQLLCEGGQSKIVVNGVATFSGCKIDKVSPVSPANPYVIVASASGLLSDESTTVAVNPGAAAKLGFTAQPNAATSSQPFAIQPVVAVQDLGGNTVTSGAFSTATVTLAIGTNPAGGTLTCTDGLTRAAVAGVATFTGCQINNGGVGYTLTASATGLTAATSTAFTVAVPAASITLTRSSSLITWGTGIFLTTQFGINGGGKTFQLQRSNDNVTWITMATQTTDTFGRATFTFRPPTNLFYRVVFSGAPDLQAATSPSVRTVVRQAAVLRPTNHGAVGSISRNTSIAFTTRVRPARPELPLARVTYSFFWRTGRTGSTWALVSQRTVTADAAGIARTTFRFSRSGQWYVRSRALSTPFNANSLWTPVERYNVR